MIVIAALWGRSYSNSLDFAGFELTAELYRYHQFAESLVLNTIALNKKYDTSKKQLQLIYFFIVFKTFVKISSNCLPMVYKYVWQSVSDIAFL